MKNFIILIIAFFPLAAVSQRVFTSTATRTAGDTVITEKFTIRWDTLQREVTKIKTVQLPAPPPVIIRDTIIKRDTIPKVPGVLYYVKKSQNGSVVGIDSLQLRRIDKDSLFADVINKGKSLTLPKL